MNILVTGGAGYIGGTVDPTFALPGTRITVYDNLCHSKRLAIPKDATFVEGDMADRTFLRTPFARAV